MKNHSRVMSIHESNWLAELETTIAKGQKTFVAVGLALAEIRDLRLYKHEYSSFAEYCEKRWGWQKSYCNHLVRAAQVVKALPEKLATMVATERQVGELAKIPAEDRAGVVQGIVHAGKPLTAAEIKRHLPPPRRRAVSWSQRPSVPFPAPVP